MTGDPLKIVRRIHELYAEPQKQPRGFIGGSTVGHPCVRYIWFAANRIACLKPISGRMGRLFETGHREEARVVAEIKKLGYDLRDINPKTGKQWEYKALDGKVQCHLDGALRGLEEDPDTWHLFECKTMKSSDFRKLCKEGVEKTKPRYWAQLHFNMGMSKLPWALFLCVQKETDDIYSERVKFDPAFYDELKAKAKQALRSNMPDPLSKDPTYYQCKWCDYWGICHGKDLPLPVCGTCVSGPEHCGKCETKELEEHLYKPHWLGEERIASGDGWNEYETVINGTAGFFDPPAFKSDKPIFKSKHLHALPREKWTQAEAKALSVLGGEVENDQQ